jgi:hypothetical protein
VTIPTIDTRINGDGALGVSISGNEGIPCGNFNYFYTNTPVTGILSYPTVSTGTMTSVPIYFDDFGGAKNWEKLAWGGTAGTTVQVLDLDGQLIPDSAIPGNSAGFAPSSIQPFACAPSSTPIRR